MPEAKQEGGLGELSDFPRIKQLETRPDKKLEILRKATSREGGGIWASCLAFLESTNLKLDRVSSWKFVGQSDQEGGTWASRLAFPESTKLELDWVYGMKFVGNRGQTGGRSGRAV